MKTLLLHGLGQGPQAWEAVIKSASLPSTECPALFASPEGGMTYGRLLAQLERQYANTSERLCLCGLSLGAQLALDFAIRHGDKVAALILIAAQYKVPSLLIDFQNLLFRCMPPKSFAGLGLSKHDVIALTHSMRSLDFTPQLGKLTCPVTIVCGERDRANLKASRELKTLLPQAKLRILPGAGHEVNQDAPQALAVILHEAAASADSP